MQPVGPGGDALAQARDLLGSDDPADLSRAADLARSALDLGVAGAGAVYAHAVDRALMVTENRQRFGTVVQRDAGEPVVWGVDPQVTDSERAGLGLPTLADRAAELWDERLAAAQAVARDGLPAGAHMRRVAVDVEPDDLARRLGADDRAAWLQGADLVFAWRGSGTEPALLVAWAGHFALQRTDRPDIWYVALRMRDVDRAVLSWFVLADPAGDVPAMVVAGRVWRGPAAPPEPARATDLVGQVITTDYRSWALAGSRSVTAYLPPGPRTGIASPVLFTTDAWVRADLVEPLILAGEIPPLVVVGPASAMSPGGRDRAAEYVPTVDPATFARHERFYVDELSQWARQELGCSDDARQRAVFGVSNGGAFAVACVARHSDRYGGMLAFSIGGPAPPSAVPPPTVRCYLAAGTLEGAFRDNTSSYADSVREAGNDVRYVERVGGHDAAVWETEFVDGLRWLFGRAGAIGQ